MKRDHSSTDMNAAIATANTIYRIELLLSQARYEAATLQQHTREMVACNEHKERMILRLLREKEALLRKIERLEADSQAWQLQKAMAEGQLELRKYNTQCTSSEKVGTD